MLVVSLAVAENDELSLLLQLAYRLSECLLEARCADTRLLREQLDASEPRNLLCGSLVHLFACEETGKRRGGLTPPTPRVREPCLPALRGSQQGDVAPWPAFSRAHHTHGPAPPPR